nr:unnamed protein product [Callosobruchus chinensis]
MVIGSLGGMRNTLLSALRAIPVCRAAAHILAARMQKALLRELSFWRNISFGENGSSSPSHNVSARVPQGSIWAPTLFMLHINTTNSNHSFADNEFIRRYIKTDLSGDKAQIRPSLEYCSRIWRAAAPTILSILDAVQRRAIRLIGDPALTCHL